MFDKIEERSGYEWECVCKYLEERVVNWRRRAETLEIELRDTKEELEDMRKQNVDLHLSMQSWKKADS